MSGVRRPASGDVSMTLYPRTAFVRSAIVVGLVIGISQALTLWFFARNAYLPGIREYARLTVLQAELAFDDSRAAADADLVGFGTND